MDPYPRTWAEIDLPTLGANLGRVRSFVGPSVKVALVAKADAYGHGMIPVCRYAVRNGADWIAVATVQEGIALRDAGIECPVLVLSPMLEIEAEQAVFYGFDIVVERLSTAVALDVAARGGGRARVHLKIDTGLSRFGVMPDEAVGVAHSISLLSNVDLVGVSQHFSASAMDEIETRRQTDLFLSTLALLSAEGITFETVQMANSAAILRYPATHGGLVRCGLLAYGFGETSRLLGNAPVMTWKARVTALRTVPSGTALSYSGSFVTSRPSIIATVGVGYGDGYPRHASNKAFVSVRDSVAPVVGNVCMDQLLLDVTDLGGVELGEVVTLIGGETSADDLANAAGTITHEVLTRLMSRVPRRYNFGK